MSSAGLILRPMQDMDKPSLGNAPSNPASPLIAQPGNAARIGWAASGHAGDLGERAAGSALPRRAANERIEAAKRLAISETAAIAARYDGAVAAGGQCKRDVADVACGRPILPAGEGAGGGSTRAR